MIEVGPDYVAPERGAMQSSTWGEVGFGSIVQDKNGHLHRITEDDGRMVKLVAAHGRQPVAVFIQRPAVDREVLVYVPSEQEAINLLHEELGARVLREIEEREHTIRRASSWELEPCEPNVNALRDHIDMIHGRNPHVGTLLSRYNPSTKPTTKKGRAELKEKRKQILQEMLDIHVELHQDPHIWPMAFPHTHTLEAL